MRRLAQGLVVAVLTLAAPALAQERVAGPEVAERFGFAILGDR